MKKLVLVLLCLMAVATNHVSAQHRCTDPAFINNFNQIVALNNGFVLDYYRMPAGAAYKLPGGKVERLQNGDIFGIWGRECSKYASGTNFARPLAPVPSYTGPTTAEIQAIVARSLEPVKAKMDSIQKLAAMNSSLTHLKWWEVVLIALLIALIVSGIFWLAGREHGHRMAVWHQRETEHAVTVVQNNNQVLIHSLYDQLETTRRLAFDGLSRQQAQPTRVNINVSGTNNTVGNITIDGDKVTHSSNFGDTYNGDEELDDLDFELAGIANRNNE